MKKIFFSLAVALTAFSSCEMTREITLNKDGSGTYVSTTDLSAMLNLAKMSGEASLDKLNDKAIDTSISLSTLVDSLKSLDATEKEIARTGKLDVAMNPKENRMKYTMSFAFKKTDDLANINQLSEKVMGDAMKKGIAASGQAAAIPTDEMPAMSIDKYFVTTYKKGLIECRLNKELYATVAEDKDAQGMKEIADMGMGAGGTKTILRLPSKAKSVEGKHATLSEDKMTVTIEAGLEDFFEDATGLEYKITY